MTPPELPSSGGTRPDDIDWALIDRYLAGTCEAHEADQARAMLRGRPHADLVLREFLHEIEPDAATPTTVEKTQLRLALREAIGTPISAPVTRASRAKTAPSWYSTTWMRALAACAVLAIGVYATTRLMPAATTAAPQREYSTHRGERATVRLADGSVVTLGAESKLRYGYPFGGKDRTVYLEGEAYFTVSHQSGKPFVVNTAHATTQVLGTEFLVKAYPTDSVAQVVVADGKIALRARTAAPDAAVTMVRGDLARLTSTGRMSLARDVAVAPYTSWMHGRLTFSGATLGAAIPDLERWYDITIVLSDPSLAKSAFSLSLDTESVDQVLASFSDVLDLEWTRAGKVITLSPARHRR